MYCIHCGKAIDDHAVICPHCGCGTKNFYQATGNGQKVNPADRENVWLSVLGFFLPLVGLILYLVWQTESPLQAKSAGKGALAGVIVHAVLSVLAIVFSAVFAVGIFGWLVRLSY